MVTSEKNEIAAVVKKALKQLYGKRLAKLVLYGSYARGEQGEASDMDFLVVLTDPSIGTGAELRYMNPVLTGLDLKYNVHIAAYPTTLRSFRESDALFYRNIRKEGMEV